MTRFASFAVKVKATYLNRKTIMTRIIACLSAVGLICLGTNVASGQNFPIKPIRIFAGGAGGSADFAARLIAQGLTGPMGQPVIVENRPANVTPDIVARSAPDGYTIHVTGSVALVAPFLERVSYDPIRDFSPITIAVSSPLVLVVHPALPVKSVKDLITLAKSKPGVLNYGNASTGGSAHLSAELFKSMANINITMIPYRAAAPALNDTLSGELQVLFSNDDSLKAHLASGRLRALAVTSAKPTALFPGLPTMASEGVPGYESASILGLWAPAGTPTSIINRFNEEILRVLSKPDVKEKFYSIGTEVVGSSPEEFSAFIKSEMTKWSKVLKGAGIGIQ